MEAHAARIAILASDVADLPAHILRRAVTAWVRESQFMPTAAELIALAKKFAMPPQPDRIRELQAHCDKINQNSWVHASGQPYFVSNRERADGTTEYFVDRAA